MSKRLSTYNNAAVDYIGKTLIVLSSISGVISLISFTSVIFLNYRDNKKILKVTRKRKKKHNDLVMLPRSKLNSIKTLVSQTLINLDISHEEDKAIVSKKEKYEQMK